MLRRCVLLLAVAWPLTAAERRLRIGPAKAAGSYVPLHAAVPTPPAFRAVVLKDERGKPIPFQWENAARPRSIILYWIEKKIDKGETLRHTVSFLETSPPIVREGVRLTKADDRIDVRIHGKLFTSYHFSPKQAKPFCFPVMGPTGKPVTRAYPMAKIKGETTDHKHHRSWYFAFGNVNGIDFWTERQKCGHIVHARFERLTSGPVFAEIRARNNWIAPNGKKVMEDRRSYRFYNVPDHCLIDWQIQLWATEGPVKMGDTKEGMAAFRVAKTLRVKSRLGGRIEDADRRVNERQCWGKRSPWCDYSGPVDGETVGIAFFDHPTSFRYPTYWMVRDYGLFGANPFGYSYFLRDKTQDGSYRIPRGGHITFNYRIYIHQGRPGHARVGEKYENFVHPPAVAVE